jgi:hypothetical protein
MAPGAKTVESQKAVHAFVLVVAGVLFGSKAPSAPVPPDEYVFVLDTSRWLQFDYSDSEEYGQVDTEGRFHVLRKVKGGLISNRPPASLINAAEPYKTYEYRSGRLILGEMTPMGNFVPETGSQVIRFEDYKYKPGAIRIWNLPGYFVRRDLLEARRKWLTEHMNENPDYAKEKAKLDAAIERKK